MEILLQQAIVQPLTTVQLTEEDAYLFREFQKRYQVLAQLVGCMDSLKIVELKNVSVLMDIDNKGKVCHTAITSHYRA